MISLLQQLDPKLWQTLLLMGIRILPIVSLAPLFGGKLAPGRLRFGYAILLTLGMLPIAETLVPAAPVSPVQLSLLAAKEALLGLIIALIVMMLFEAFTAAGALIDVARGATMANVLDPMSQQQRSAMGVFYQQLGVVLFLTLGGHRLLIEAVASSFSADVAPPFDVQQVSRLTSSESALLVVDLLGDLLTVAFRLAAPVIVLLLALDVALGIINRLAQQIQVYFLGLTLKGSLGVLVLVLAVGVSFEQVFSDFLAVLRHWLAGG